MATTADPTTTYRPICLHEAPCLLEHEYLALEAGHGLTADNMYHIAASTYMPGVTVDMIHWWFGWLDNTEQYKLWHPRDHVFLKWDVPSQNDATYIGRHCRIDEYIGGVLASLVISFKSPADFFGPGWEEDFKSKGYGTAVCARVGRVAVDDDVGSRGQAKGKDFSGNVTYMGHLVHLIKNEPDGVRMRSRFWLGDVEGLEQNVGDQIPDSLKAGLLKHCTEEMAILASKLPGLYAKYRR